MIFVSPSVVIRRRRQVKWRNHDVVMKKSHTSALSGAARVIKED